MLARRSMRSPSADSKWIKSYDKTRARRRCDCRWGQGSGRRARGQAEGRRSGGDAESGGARAKAKATAVKVGGQVKSPTKIKDVAPVYPEIAKSARVRGRSIEATIGADGKV
jgi:hypothetical protein